MIYFEKRIAALALSVCVVLAAGAAEKLLVVGDATWGGWSLDRTSVMVRDSSDPDVFRYTGRLEADKEFKVLTDAQWDRQEYRNASTDPYIAGEGNLIVCDNNENDNKFKVRETANYDIVCDLKEMKISVAKSSFQDAPVLHDVLYLVGDATPGGWALGASLPLTQNPSDLLRFSGRVSLSPGIFKIATNCYGGYNEQKFFFRDRDDAGRISEDGTDDRQWTVNEEGTYDVAVDLRASTIAIEPAGARSVLGAVTSWSREGGVLTVTAQGGILQLTPYNDHVIKVFTLPAGSTATERRSISVCAVPECEFGVEETPETIRLTTDALTVSVNRADCKVEFIGPDGTTVLREDGGLDNSAIPRRISFEGMGDAAFYGGGYNGQRVDLNGQTLVMNNTQTGGWDCTWAAPHNICIPFVVSASGYGLLFDDHYRYARITPSSEGTSYSSGSLDPVAYYYVGSADGSMASVMENYTFLTGRQELPPYWALGYMTSRYGYHSRSEAEEVVAGIKNAGLPLDGIVFDLYWQGEGNSGMGNLDWYTPKWNDPAGMMADFSRQGVKTVCITEPFFTSVSSNYNTLRDLGYFADEDVAGMDWLGAPRTGLIDSSNPAAMDWMWNFYKARTLEGVGGWWLDLGEPERHDDDSRHAGGTVNQIHNEFGDLWTARVYRGFKEDFPDVRPFLMPRAGTAGMQRYSTFPWTGDIKRSYLGLEAQVPALLSAGMSGIGYMGNDVSGFAADGIGTDSWLYLRWIEMAVFSPMMRTHSTYNPEPYLECYADVFPAVKKYIRMRYSYLPYTYTLAWENATKGAPLARPINYHDVQEAPASPSDCRDQYLWGRDIMVAPVLTCNTFSRTITFPQGEWVDLNDFSKTYAGGATVTYDVPLETLPFFGRKGAFITTFTDDDFTSTSDVDPSRLTVTYLADFRENRSADSNVSRSVLFDDDHHSTASLRDGQTLLTTFEGENTANGHIIRILNSGSYEGMPSRRTYTLVIPGYTGVLGGVGDQDKVYSRVTSRDDFDAAAEGTYFLDSDNTLRIKAGVASRDNLTLNVSHTPLSALTTTAADVQAVLEYSASAGILGYSLPAGSSDATVTVRDSGGKLMASFAVSRADGTVAQYPFPSLAPGLYFATLTAVSPSGTPLSKTIKCPVAAK